LGSGRFGPLHFLLRDHNLHISHARSDRESCTFPK
jgi:hypothetical protein